MTDSTTTSYDATRALGRQLLDTLASGWSKGVVDTMVAVFSEEAVFIETPFSAPKIGIHGIREWANDIPYYQSDVTFSTGVVYVAGPWFSTEFKATFRRRRTGEWVVARGAIFCETEGDRISEMRMYWHRATS